MLDSVDAVMRFAQTMTWKGKHPIVELVTSIYQTGVKLTKEAMHLVQTHLQRWSSLETWFVDILSSLPPEIPLESRPALQEKSQSQKRSRGRPRIKPLPDPTQPKRSRGRPRTKPLPDPTQPKRPRGRPPKPVLTERITLIATSG
ncbi:MAG: hypothetical protein NVS2B2_39220 [Ktedonobacteraceae bacterium]